jgi:hypothetical protein
MSMSAICLQWLFSMPPGGMMACKSMGIGMCEVAEFAHEYAQKLMQQEGGLQPQQQLGTADWVLLKTTNQAVVELSAAVLGKLVTECRSLPDSSDSNTDSSSASSSMDDASSVASSVTSSTMQACEYVVGLLSGTFCAAARAELGPLSVSQSQRNDPNPAMQPPVPHGQCCKLLQDCVRLAAAVPPSVRSINAKREPLAATIVSLIGSMLGQLRYSLVGAVWFPRAAPSWCPLLLPGTRAALTLCSCWGCCAAG